MPTDREIPLTRSNQGWLLAPQQWLVAWIVAALPRWGTPDPPTAVGFVAAIAAFPALNVAACLKLPGQFGQLARDEAPAGKDHQKRMPPLA